VTAELTEDRLLGGRVRLTQPATGYRVGIEPILLAASIAAPLGARVADLGCGAGAAALCLLARRPDVGVMGIESDKQAASLARANAELNGMAGRLALLEQDVRQVRPGAERCQAAMSNPPFHAERATDASPDAAKARATIETDLASWVEAASRLLEPRGTLTLIYRADRLDALLAALAPRFGGAAILPLWPREATPAKRIILRATLGSRAPLTLHPGLVLHGEGNSYTQAVAAILRDAAPLTF
jgi:tRNA1(Val) A37 N6-methylase TrmN6